MLYKNWNQGDKWHGDEILFLLVKDTIVNKKVHIGSPHLATDLFSEVTMMKK